MKKFTEKEIIKHRKAAIPKVEEPLIIGWLQSKNYKCT